MGRATALFATVAALCLTVTAWGVESSASSPVYRVGPQDLLRIDVFDNEKLSAEYTVDADGNLVFPLLGQVAVRGLSVAEIQDRLKELLEKDYLWDAKVSVIVKEYRSQKVRLLSGVGRPGTYTLEGPTRLLDLIAKAEGISPMLGEIRRGQIVRIVRGASDSGTAGASRSIIVDLHKLVVAAQEDANVFLEGGDVIWIGQSESVHVVGEVKFPGTFPWDAEMTVLKAISLAGGATKKGSQKKAVIVRIIANQEVRIDAKAADRLKPDDIVDVPLSFW